MIDVIVVCEGQTEQAFVGDVLAPFLAERLILIQPRLIATSRRGQGGALGHDRVMRYLRNTLRERRDTYVTTLFDLYGLVPDFPGLAAAAALTDPIERAVAIEGEFGALVVRVAECRRQDVRESATSPEHINDGRDTHPSARLNTLLHSTKYRKVLHGSAVSARIGVERIRAECRHFGEWLRHIEGLPPLRRTE